jgi:transcription elongation GreA/GreB family factor
LVSKQTNDPRYRKEGYIVIGNDSPLGSAIEGAEAGDIVSYPKDDQKVRVELLQIES